MFTRRTIIIAIALAVGLVYFIRYRRRSKRTVTAIKQAAPQKLSVDEIIATMEASAKPEDLKRTQEENVALQRLANTIQALRALQLRLTKEPSVAVQPEEVNALGTEIERDTGSNRIAHDTDTKEYEVLLYLAYKEYDRLQTTERGRKLLQRYFGDAVGD